MSTEKGLSQGKVTLCEEIHLGKYTASQEGKWCVSVTFPFPPLVAPSGPTQCEVECETETRGVQASGRSFPDGTVCQSVSSFPAFCVAGVCTVSLSICLPACLFVFLSACCLPVCLSV